MLLLKEVWHVLVVTSRGASRQFVFQFCFKKERKAMFKMYIFFKKITEGEKQNALLIEH